VAEADPLAFLLAPASAPASAVTRADADWAALGASPGAAEILEDWQFQLEAANRRGNARWAQAASWALDQARRDLAAFNSLVDRIDAEDSARGRA
jgi:hypothetical protein